MEASSRWTESARSGRPGSSQTLFICPGNAIIRRGLCLKCVRKCKMAVHLAARSKDQWQRSVTVGLLKRDERMGPGRVDKQTLGVGMGMPRSTGGRGCTFFSSVVFHFFKMGKNTAPKPCVCFKPAFHQWVDLSSLLMGSYAALSPVIKHLGCVCLLDVMRSICMANKHSQQQVMSDGKTVP